MISVGYDYVTPSQYPGVWNLKKVFLMSSVLAIVAVSISLITSVISVTEFLLLLLLLAASVFALSLSTLIALVWPDSQPDGISALGFVEKKN